MSRPAVLFPLFAELTALDGVGPKLARLFAKLNIEKPADLLFTLPVSGIDRQIRASIRDVALPGVATVEVEIGLHHPGATRTRPYRIHVRDAFTEFQLVYFHPRADWLRTTFPAGQRRIVSGRVELFDGIAQMAHPDHVLRPGEVDRLPEFEPVYPLTEGLTQRAMTRAVAEALERVRALAEWIEPSLKARRRWPDWDAALAAAHAPAGPTTSPPPRRPQAALAYDELFAHQVTLALARAHMKRPKGHVTAGNGRLRAAVLAALPYSPTGAQTRAVAEITGDMATPNRMNRLLQGDVGAGKTLVNLLAMLATVEAGGRGGADARPRSSRASITPASRRWPNGGRPARHPLPARQGRRARSSSPRWPRARSRFSSAPMRSFRRRWRSETSASPSSTSSTGSASASAWISAPRARRRISS